MYRTVDQQRRDEAEYLEDVRRANRVKPLPPKPSREMEMMIVAIVALIVGTVLGWIGAWWMR